MVVEVEDEVGEPVQVDESEEEPGVYKVAYYPTKPGKNFFSSVDVNGRYR